MRRKSFKKGIIVSSISNASKKLYSMIPKSFAGSIFGKEHKEGNGLFSYLIDLLKFKKRVSSPVKKFMAKSFDRSLILNKLKQIVSYIPSIQMRTIGLFFFAFGLFCSVADLLNYGLSSSVLDFTNILTPLIIFCVGGILTLSQKSCYEAVKESKILSTLIFRLMGIKKQEKYLEKKIIAKGHIGLITGIVAGIIGTFTSPYHVILFLVSVLVLTAVMYSPEAGTVLMFLITPFVSARSGAALTLIVAFSWLIKLSRGKRTLKLGFFEFVLIALGISMLFGGSVSVVRSASENYSSMLVCGIVGYFVIANNVKTAEWIKRCVNALLLSFGFKLIYGTVGIITSFVNITRYSDVTKLVNKSSQHLFGYNSFLAVLCVALLPFFLLGMFKSHKESKRSLYIVLTAIAFYCLICGHSSGALISVIVGGMILLVLSTPSSLGIIASASILIPTVISLLPSGVTGYLFRLLGFSNQALNAGHSSFSTLIGSINNAWVGGIGLGETNINVMLPIYGFDTSNTAGYCDAYTGLILGIGITGLFIFTVFIITFTGKFLSYIKTSQNDDASIKHIGICSFTGAVSVLIMGFTANIFSDPSVFYILFYLCALTVCSINAAREDRNEIVLEGPYLDISCNNIKQETRKDV